MKNPPTSQPQPDPAIELAITLPIHPPCAGTSNSEAEEPLSLVASLAADTELGADFESVVQSVVDVLGSAVAESTGWRPPEAEEID